MNGFGIKYNFDPQTLQFIAEIPELYLSDYGDTIEEAQNNLFIALELYLKEKYSVPNTYSQFANV